MASKKNAKDMKQGARGPKPSPRPVGKQGAAKAAGAKPATARSAAKATAAKPARAAGTAKATAAKPAKAAAPRSKSASPLTGPSTAKATRKEVAAKKKATARIETGRPAPTLPQAANAARTEHRIPAARERSAAAAPIKLAEPPRSGVVRPRTHLAETPAPPPARRKR